MKDMAKIGEARSAKFRGHYHPFRIIFRGGGKILKSKEKHTKKGQNLELGGGGNCPLLRQALSSILTATDNVTMMGLSLSTLSRTYLRHKRYSLG